MVKNTTGGGGHKKFARKFASHGQSALQASARTSSNSHEIYAVVVKMLGNNMFTCHGIDNVLRLGHIRGRFTGRNKRHNMILVGSWVLVGDREWDSAIGSGSTAAHASASAPKLRHCDLMEVFSEDAKKQLMSQHSENWAVLNANDVTRIATSKKDGGINGGYGGGDGDDFGVYFTTERDEMLSDIMQDASRIGAGAAGAGASKRDRTHAAGVGAGAAAPTTETGVFTEITPEEMDAVCVDDI